MKKIISIVLVLASVLAFAACGKEPVLTGTLEEIADQIYASATSVEMSMGPATEIDLADVDTANYYLGVASTDSIERAVFSEPMIGSIPYSLCLVKVKEGADEEALKNEILNGVNVRKWLCVAAEKVAVTSCDGVIMMVMADEATVDAICTAFAAITEENAAEPLTRAGEAQEELPLGDGIVLG